MTEATCGLCLVRFTTDDPGCHPVVHIEASDIWELVGPCCENRNQETK